MGRVAALVVLAFVGLAAGQGANVGRDKAESLRELASISEDNIIVLNATGYQHYIIDYPRPYDLVMLFNADYTKYKCNPCEEIAA
jgi:hypothetical protein